MPIILYKYGNNTVIVSHNITMTQYDSDKAYLTRYCVGVNVIASAASAKRALWQVGGKSNQNV